MRILTRYLIRAHVGPFLFALTALTGLLFLNAVAQRLDDLAGKGLSWDVILEFLYLSLPHTMALTLPMAVLVAVLYAFSELTANNEITAMKAGGVRPQRILLPLLAVGTLVAGGMLYFNDQLLPEANHRLKNLMVDINRKTPTFSLREQVVNEIRTNLTGETYHLTASRIDNRTSELHDVTIYDGTDPQTHRTTYAQRGVMAFNESRTDLFLTLYDGVVLETTRDEPGSFQQTFFEKQVLPIRGVGNELERRAGGLDRSDREMSIGMLADRAENREAERDAVRTENLVQTRTAVRAALGLPVPEDDAGLGRSARRSRPERRFEEREGLEDDELTTVVARRASTNATRASTLRKSANSYRVEIHKKYTLAFACIVFVLVGAPLAIRFPRGGLGLVIAASSAIFAVYWMGLIGGESLADRNVAPPAITMWVPNLVFTVVGLVLFKRMGREVATTRGGGWEDVFYTLSKPFRGVLGGGSGGASTEALTESHAERV